MSETCAVTKRADWGFRPVACGKPAKGSLDDGTVACGSHLGAEKRVKANDARRAAEADERRARMKQAQDAASAVNAYDVGLDATTYTPSYGPLGGGPNPDYVTVRADALLALLRRAEVPA